MARCQYIQGIGPLNPSIVIVGEYPTKDDVAGNAPFCGGAGRILKREILNAGLNLNEIRFELFCDHPLPSDGVMSESDFFIWKTSLNSRLLKLKPSVVVLCGEKPLRCFLPNTKISDQHCYILKQSQDMPYLIPIYHPSYVMKGNWKDTFWLRLGLNKARMIAHNLAPNDYKHELTIAPTFEQVIEWFSSTTETDTIACDIERTRSQEISCVSFADRPDRAISIPFIVEGQSYWSPEQEKKMWLFINSVLSSNRPKVFHNHIFDVLCFSYEGVEVSGDIHDTMTTAHLLHPELPKKLGDVGRIHTWGPEWKSKGEWKDVKNWNEFWTYNAMDSARTIECFREQKNLLISCDRWDFYEKHLLRLVEPVYKMCARGWNIDQVGVEEEKKETARLMGEINDKINKIAVEHGMGMVNPRSHVQLKDLFKRMGVKIPNKKGRESLDNTSLSKLYLKHKLPIITDIMKYREAGKFLSSYLNARLDSDNKFRFSIIIPGTVSSRFSSSQTPNDTGGNSQNIPQEFKKYIVPDKGKVIVDTDLNRADAQVVAWLSQDRTMLKTLAGNVDMHIVTANSIFGLDITKLPKAEYKKKRALGKKANHALNYGMGAKRFKDDTLESTGIDISLDEAKRIIDGYFRTYPGIKEWHRSTEAQIKQTRKLVTPHGRVRTFLGYMDDEMFRNAYAYIPPTTVGDSINTTLIKFNSLITKYGLDAQIIGQTHDSLVFQVAEKELKTALEMLDVAMKASVFYIHGKPCNIAYGVKVGNNWGTLRKVQV